ncbi:Guanylate kinase [Phytophthora cinnamomi]|uniref:Guanylate kinase n=1 Tax=Phytophthora cinnamomi TaxID=4785 RepID=UPI0035597CC8|nr:Guanylate kinase [Phytophthora cinnamomi]
MFGYFAEKLNVKNLGELLAPTLTPEQEFHAAIEQGLHDKFVRMLEEQNMDPNAKNEAGNLPIHTAAYYGRVDFLELLLAHNVDVNAMCPRQNSPLHYAAAQSRDDAVKYLVNSGANPALRNRSGRTPYDVAKGDNIRQFLLPLQFRHEDPAQAASMLPPGITPSVDPMAPRPVIAPPPLSGDYSAVQGPPMGMPPQQHTPQNNLYAAATHSAIPRGGPSRFARPKDYRPIQADGFGSSVGNEELTAKFGNKREIKVTAPPPSVMMPPAPAPVDVPAPEGAAPSPPAPGVNPYASTYANKPRTTPGGYPGYAPPNAGVAARGPPQFKIFNPKLANNADAAAPAAVPAVQPPAFGAAPAPQYAPAQPVAYDAPAQDEEVNLSANASVLQ